MPAAERFIVAARETVRPFRVRAAAETPVAGVAPAVINAICDATGVRLREAPATPERVWR
jgi:CO/xanthine dehydrogenase Mo-binding subunit